MSQAQTVLKHLRENEHLTSLEAIMLYRIPRLAARVYDLRQAGYDIESEVKFDATQRDYTRYRLVA
jgi:hypothetical protein